MVFGWPRLLLNWLQHLNSLTGFVEFTRCRQASAVNQPDYQQIIQRESLSQNAACLIATGRDASSMHHRRPAQRRETFHSAIHQLKRMRRSWGWRKSQRLWADESNLLKIRGPCPALRPPQPPGKTPTITRTPRTALSLINLGIKAAARPVVHQRSGGQWLPLPDLVFITAATCWLTTEGATCNNVRNFTNRTSGKTLQSANVSHYSSVAFGRFRRFSLCDC